jgi:hypothetical protein
MFEVASDVVFIFVIILLIHNPSCAGECFRYSPISPGSKYAKDVPGPLQNLGYPKESIVFSIPSNSIGST